nr:ATP-binding protein [Caldilineaceae bacterium]
MRPNSASAVWAAAGAGEIVQALVTAQARHRFLTPGEAGNSTPLVVAVSGGVDSLTLLHALLQLADGWQISLHVAHLDHALRPHSASDASF